MHIYEYLFTAIIIFFILVASSTMISSMPQPSLSVSEKEQLKVATQKILTQLILNTGDPPDWGSNTALDAPAAFGLAKHGETTRDAFVLDPDKVQRLSSANPLYVTPQTVANLLNLGNDYGFTIEFRQALTVELEQTGTADYNIQVTSDQNSLPIANVNVTAKAFYYANNQFACTGQASAVTSIDGRCSISFTDLPQQTQAQVLLVTVDYYGTRIVKTAVTGQIEQAALIGNHIVMNTQPNQVESTAHQVLVYKTATGYALTSVTSSFTQDSNMLSLDYAEPSAVATITFADGKAILAAKTVPQRYSTIPSATSVPFAYTVERSVTINGEAYTLQLRVWRMSW